MASGDVVHVAAPRTRAPRSTNTSGHPTGRTRPGSRSPRWRRPTTTRRRSDQIPREHEWHRDDAGCVLGGTCAERAPRPGSTPPPPKTVRIRQSECSQPDERKVTDQVDVGFFSGNTVMSQHTGRHVRVPVGMAPVMNVIMRSRRACVWTVGALVTAALASAGVAFRGHRIRRPHGCAGMRSHHRCSQVHPRPRTGVECPRHHRGCVGTRHGASRGDGRDRGRAPRVGAAQRRPRRSRLDRHLPTAPLPGMGDPERASATGLCRPRLPLAVGADRRLGEPSGHRCRERVQRSATPNAYASWEAEARTIAGVTTGEVTGALHCTAP